MKWWTWLIGILLAQCNSSTEPEGNYDCGVKKNICAQMANCSEANYYLKTCGIKELDHDGDGIPCEADHCGGD